LFTLFLVRLFFCLFLSVFPAVLSPTGFEHEEIALPMLCDGLLTGLSLGRLVRKICFKSYGRFLFLWRPVT
jgi:hypothetical protein